MNKKTSPLVSVIVPIYGCELYIGECLDSILLSTYKNYEIIIVDDGSPDNSLSIAQKYANKYQNIKIIAQENKGVCYARNNAISEARGLFILPIDGDDKIAPTYIEKAVSALNNDKSLGIVYCEAEFFGCKKGKWCLPKYSFPDVLNSNLIFCSALFRKSDWEKVGGYKKEMTLGLEDWEFWLSLIETGVKVYRIPEILFYYRQKSRDSRNSLSESNFLSMVAVIVWFHKSMYSAYSYMLHPHILKILATYQKVSYYLLNCIPIYEKRTKLDRVVYNFLGILKLQIIRANKFTEYFCIYNIPILKVIKK